ncbi:uncharacterized protein LOC108664619 [Hyalella azteca]|uniref:Uncharacterized protein LOC108664619 n=1 Tax=Hyalella azteca TaxID=294128 RepID=A0A8B7MYS2_HYAAZ|nr:uncharacterized protein LOC108664619 [Hyalella azteca]
MSHLKQWRRYRTEINSLALPTNNESAAIVCGTVDNIETKGNLSPTVTNRDTVTNTDTTVTLEDDLDNNVDNLPATVLEFDGTEIQTHSLLSDSSILEDSCDSDALPCENTTDEEIVPDLTSQLAEWAVKNNQTRSSINELLLILRMHGHSLPKDARTLLQTPKIIQIKEKCNGTYQYFGLKSGISRVIEQHGDFFRRVGVASLNFNVDGMPLFKSSSLQLWPILCSVENHEPFIVGIYCGKHKPSPVAEYLSDFLLELNELLASGLNHQDVQLKIVLGAFICDAPARAFLKCIKGHNAYYSCERCIAKGTWAGRVVFNLPVSGLCSLRTDEEFSGMKYADHQISPSPLIALGVKCITAFPLDYMHSVCLGAVRRILNFFKSGPRVCKLSQNQIGIISEKMTSLNGKMPREFARQPRSLEFLDRWKATEFRQFLLYTGPLVLLDVVGEEVYNHFVSLTVALSILLDSNDLRRNAYLSYARELLIHFVCSSTNIYGETFVTYNIHSLIHLADDASNYEMSLNRLSAFPFENYLQKLKKLVKNGKNPVSQIAKRLHELNCCKSGTSPNTRMFVSASRKDGVFLLKNNLFAFVNEKKNAGSFLCTVISQRQVQNFFTHPCDSMLLNIGFLSEESISRFGKSCSISIEDIERKVICLPFGAGQLLLLPLLHETERHL